MPRAKIQGIDKYGRPIELDDGEIVADGCGIRTSMMLMDGMDSVQKEIAASRSTNVRVVDAAGRPAGSRPGFCFDANRNGEVQARIAYEQMVARNSTAWRGSSAAPAATISGGTPAQLRDQAYDAMVRRNERAWMTPGATAAAISDASKTLDDPEAERERAYEERKARLSEAWRTPTGVKFGGSFGA